MKRFPSTRRAGTVVAALAFAVLVSVPSAAVAADDGKPGYDDDPTLGSNVDAKLWAAQAPLTDAATAISALDPDRKGLAGIRLQVDKHTVEVWWKGEVPDQVSEEIAKDEAAGVHIALSEAKYSGVELTTAQNQMVTDRDRYPGITLLAPQVDGSGLQGYFTDPEAAAGYEYPIPVAIAKAPETAYTSRGSDSVPWWAGGVIRTGGVACSSGFAVRHYVWPFGELNRGLLTAAHCDPMGGGSTFTNGTGTTIGVAGAPIGIPFVPFSGTDSTYIMGPSAGRTHDGGVGTGEFSDAVVGSVPNFPGQFVCTSGASTGAHCGIVTFIVGGVWFMGGAVTFGITLGQQVAGGLAVGSGDSGGPVFVPGGLPGVVHAAGLISFAMFPFGCAVGICSSMVGFIDINVILGANALSLVP